MYEKRHHLRSDNEIIADIKFRQSLWTNPNGYTEEGILNLVNTPKEILFTAVQLSENDLKGLVENREEFISKEAEKIKNQRKEIKNEIELIAAGLTK